jgi:hypothetical protein
MLIDELQNAHDSHYDRRPIPGNRERRGDTERCRYEIVKILAKNMFERDQAMREV